MHGNWSKLSRLRSRALGLAFPTMMVLASLGCEQDLPPSVSSSEFPDQEVRSFTLTQSVEGKREWRLTAGSAATYRGRGVILAQDISLDFFDPEDRVYSHLTAQDGEIESATNNMVARGNVVVITENGTRIETETLHYLNSESRIFSDELVTVRKGGDVLSGVGFESDPSLENFEFRERVRAKVTSSSDKKRDTGETGP